MINDRDEKEVFQRLKLLEDRQLKLERLIYIVIGLGMGSGALTLSQVVG